MHAAGVAIAHFDGVVPNPTTESITAGARVARDHRADVVVGFGGGSIATMIFGESLVVSLTGCLTGMILTFPAAKAFGQTLSTWFPIFIVSEQTLWLDLLAAFLIAFFAAIIPARRAIRIGIAEGLRRIGSWPFPSPTACGISGSAG